MIKFINGNNEIILDEKEFEISFQNLDEKTIRLDFYKPTTDVDIYSFNLNINIEENITFILNDFLEKKIYIRNIGYGNVLKPTFGSFPNAGKELATHCFIIGEVL